jgi:AraC-like DNA-binding protein
VKYYEAKPRSILRNYIKCFWYLEEDYSSNYLSIETILPDGCVDFVFQVNGAALTLQTGDQSILLTNNFLIGLQKSPVRLFSKTKSAAYGIRFFAYGVYPFLRTPLHELQETVLELEDLFGNQFSELAEKAQTFPIRRVFEEFEKFLLPRLANFKTDIQPVEAATRLLFQRQGFTDIAKLALELNMTARSLERKFDEAVGISPKALARVIRFDNIKNELILNPRSSLTSLSFRYGYFDQAHFIRDFKQFSGDTPSTFKEEVLKEHIYFREHTPDA